jgi:MFS family permease
VVGVRNRGKYQGYFTGAFGISSVAGPLVGGWLTEEFSWRWVFYVNLPVGALALFLILTAFPPHKANSAARIDYPGAALLALSTGALLLALSVGGSVFAWTSLPVLALGAVSIIAGVLFAKREKREDEPILDLTMFRERAFSVAVLCSTLMSFAMMGTMVFVPLYFQLVMGMDPVSAGMMLLPQVGAMMLSAIIGGQLVARRGRFKLFLSIALALEATSLIGMAAAATLGAGAEVFGVFLAIKGLGMGIGLPNATTAVQNAVPHARIGIATSTMTFLRSLGGALGVALAGAILAPQLGVYASLDPEALRSLLLNDGALDAAAANATRQAYQHAIAASMAPGGAAMILAFLACVFALPSQALRERDVEPQDLP